MRQALFPNGNDNGNENQNGDENNQEVNNGNGSKNQVQRNDEFSCDMSGDFNLQDYDYYINDTKINYTFHANKLLWGGNISIESRGMAVSFSFAKNANNLIVKKTDETKSNHHLFTIRNVEKTNDNRIKVTLTLINQN